MSLKRLLTAAVVAPLIVAGGSSIALAGPEDGQRAEVEVQGPYHQAALDQAAAGTPASALVYDTAAAGYDYPIATNRPNLDAVMAQQEGRALAFSNPASEAFVGQSSNVAAVAPDPFFTTPTNDPFVAGPGVMSRPIPDTPENRARYGQPMSRAGRMTDPIGN